jgi:hypothetical protein
LLTDVDSVVAIVIHFTLLKKLILDLLVSCYNLIVNLNTHTTTKILV